MPDCVIYARVRVVSGTSPMVLVYGDKSFTGAHEPLCSPATFERVQNAFRPVKITKAAELKNERNGFELALHALSSHSDSTTALVAALAGSAAQAHVVFDRGDVVTQREVLNIVLRTSQ